MDTANSSGPRARVYEEILSALKRTKPASVYVVQADGSETRIELRNGTTRWQQAAKVASAMMADGADRVELRAESGGVADTISAAVKPGGPKEPAAQAPEERFLRLMLRAQEVALDRQSALFKDAFQTTNELMRTLVMRVNQLEAVHSKVLNAQWEAVTALAEAEGAAEESPGMRALTELAGAAMASQAAKASKKAG